MVRAYLRLKACPRCSGDLLLDRAFEEDEEVCIQCGYRKFRKDTDNNRPQNELEKTATVIYNEAYKAATKGFITYDSK